MLVSLLQCPLMKMISQARKETAKHTQASCCHHSTMAHVHCTATGYAASQNCKAYVGVLCGE